MSTGMNVVGKISEQARTTAQSRVRSQYKQAQMKNNATHCISERGSKEHWNVDQ